MSCPRSATLLAALASLTLGACYPYRAAGNLGPYPYGPPAPSPGGTSPWEASPLDTRPVTADDPVEVQWKERMAQPYVFLEHNGDYRLMGATMRQLMQAAAGLPVTGPPFALFYDDPGSTPLSELRARVCLPVATEPQTMPSDFRYEVLPRSMVVYARVSGPYDHAGRIYGQLFAYMQKLNWKRGGPIRETYLVNPGEVADPARLWAEVQIPCQVN